MMMPSGDYRLGSAAGVGDLSRPNCDLPASGCLRDPAVLAVPRGTGGWNPFDRGRPVPRNSGAGSPYRLLMDRTQIELRSFFAEQPSDVDSS